MYNTSELFVSRHPRANRDNWKVKIIWNDQQDIFKKFCKVKCKQAQTDVHFLSKKLFQFMPIEN